MDQHKKPREEEPSVTVDNSQLVNTTIVKPYMSGSIKPAGSLFKQQAEAKQVNPRNRIMAEMKARNFTTDYAAMSSKKHALEYDDDDSDSEINPSNMNNRTITRRERKLCTNFTVKPAANEFTMKYRDFSWIASGSYATVERCYRKSDNAEFVMKYMAIRDIVDKIVRLVCGLGRKEAENMAILLCDNEIEVSRVLAPNSNISTIDDYYFDKVEGSYRLFSRFAQHGTLMSESHIRYVAMMSDHNSPEIPYIYKKSLFRNIVEGLQHSRH